MLILSKPFHSPKPTERFCINTSPDTPFHYIGVDKDIYIFIISQLKYPWQLFHPYGIISGQS